MEGNNLDRKYQIFISSTYEDLKVAREKVKDAILSMYHFPVGMELFGAADEEQWEIIRETIDSSDYYVLIIAQRYGSIISEGPDAGMSYTEREFRYAKAKGIPILVFLMNDDVAVRPVHVDKEPEKVEKLREFKNEIKTGRTVVWWSNEDELATKVTTSLYKEFSRKKRPGWIRGNAIDLEKSLGENITPNADIEEYTLYDEDHLKYELCRECRVIKEDNFSGIILCGNELINVGVREEGGVGRTEIEIVDFFLGHIEFFNHSGRYKGIVVATYFFNDNRYGSISVNIKYLLPKGTEPDISEEELKTILDTEFKCNPIFIFEVKYEFI